MPSKAGLTPKASFSLFQIDAYFAQEEVEFETMPQPLETDAPELYQKLMNDRNFFKRMQRKAPP